MTDTRTFTVGQAVQHAFYGEGVVVSVWGWGPIVVRFTAFGGNIRITFFPDTNMSEIT